MSLVVVAIPREDDYVWKISSEKKPHCTLLFLGEDTGRANEVAAFIQHAITIGSIEPFGLSVDYRGTLGADNADVLFFRQDWATKRLAEFRSMLLKDNTIRSAYDSADQFPVWNPHLTLGYPTAPAKKDDRDYPGIHWVEFDRIALWTGNFEGPEFRLTYNDVWEEMSMSIEEQVADLLTHSGVKGMKWGVRKDRSSKSSAPAKLAIKDSHSSVTKRVIKDYNQMDDKQFKSKYSVSKSVYAKRVEKHGDPFMNSPLAKVGKKLPGAGKDLRRTDTPSAVVTKNASTAIRGHAKVTTQGGQGHNAHTDAVAVATKKRVLKKSGTAALSNKDLQDIIQRTQLEQQARQATQSRGQKAVKKLLGEQTKQQINREVQDFTRKKRAGA